VRTGGAGPFSLTTLDSRKNLSFERHSGFVPVPFLLIEDPTKRYSFVFGGENKRRPKHIVESAAASTLLCKPLDQKDGFRKS